MFLYTRTLCSSERCFVAMGYDVVVKLLLLSTYTCSSDVLHVYAVHRSYVSHIIVSYIVQLCMFVLVCECERDGKVQREREKERERESDVCVLLLVGVCTNCPVYSLHTHDQFIWHVCVSLLCSTKSPLLLYKDTE